MTKYSKPILLSLTLLIGIALQFAFILADSRDTPRKTAVAFSKKYFRLDPSMDNYLTAALNSEAGENAVDRYLHRIHTEAAQQGFRTDFLKYQLFSIHTATTFKDNKNAFVTFSANRRVEINPLFAFVARVFSLGSIQPVYETIEMVNENGRWKVSGSPFMLLKAKTAF